MQDFDALWNYNNPVVTEKLFRDLLPKAPTQSDTSYHPELLTQIGRTLSLQQKFAKAHQILDQAEKLLTPATAVARVRYLLERGRTYRSSDHPEQAQAAFVDAWDLARDIKAEFYAVDAAHMIALVTTGEDAINWHLAALDYAEQSTEERARRWRGSLYNNLGWTYDDMERYDDAHHMFVKALAARQEQGDAELIRVAQWCIGRVLRSRDQLEEALALQRELETVYEALEQPSGYTYEEIAECLLALERRAASRPYFAKAYDILAQDIWLTKNESARLQRLHDLAQ